MLAGITCPQDIKGMTIPQLERLAAQIRRRLLEVVSETGGHLASNLGAVELTLALNYVFDFPTDNLIWDVGHQAYVHKILTGRNDRFDSIRCQGGLSGFPKACESPYDCFGTGHASTSISAGVGFALARDAQKQKHEVIAVIGDGALTGGMAYEGMNHAGHLGLNMKIILNDNERSIDSNVGGFAENLTKFRSDPTYRRAKKDLDAMVKAIPALGPKMSELAERLTESVKTVLVPGDSFESFGLKYYGPVDGHDLEALIHVLRNAKAIKQPLLVHVMTTKGKGYAPAEERPGAFHGTGPFVIDSGESKKAASGPSYTDVFAKTLIRLAAADHRIVGITAAMGSGTGLQEFGEHYPKRVFDVGIAEEHAATMAASMAMGGLRPVLALYSTFLQRSIDQVIHDIALQDAPVVLAVDRAGLVGEDGPTHHGVFDLSYLSMIPNMIVMAPKDEVELAHMLYSAFRYEKPVAVRYPRGRGPGGNWPDTHKFIPAGKGEVLREGEDLVLTAIGSMVAPALEAAERLEEEGLSVGVVNARFAKPLDDELLKDLAERYPTMITLEENVLSGGFGQRVRSFLQEEGYALRIHSLGLPDEFVEHGKSEDLKAKLGLDVDGIVREVLSYKEAGKLER